jgi:hypothetical protein
MGNSEVGVTTPWLVKEPRADVLAQATVAFPLLPVIEMSRFWPSPRPRMTRFRPSRHSTSRTGGRPPRRHRIEAKAAVEGRRLERVGRLDQQAIIEAPRSGGGIP